MSSNDDVFNKLDKIQENLEAIDGENQVSMDDLFDSSFMEKYTNFHNMPDFLKQPGLEITTSEQFKAFDEKELDKFVNKSTQFSTWSEMQHKASDAWISRQLGRGL